MKKLISVILTVIMLVLPVGALADSATSADIEKVLIVVKTKITVPAELTEFSSYVRERNEKTYYNLEWANEDYSKTMSVSCDGEGRITSYSNYTNDTSGKKISSFTRDEIVSFASSFVSKALPETIRGEDDVLVYDDSSYDARGNMRYSMRFDRRKETVKVKDSYADVTVCEVDGELFIRNMSVSYDYDTEFMSTADTVSDYKEKYKAAFPAELIYRNEYNYYAPKGMPKTKPVLVYRIKDDSIGYIDAETGEVIAEDAVENELFKAEEARMTADSAGGSGSSKEILTQQEIEEIGKIEGLLSVADIEKTIKKLPYVEFAGDMVLTSHDLSKYDEDYTYSLYYSNNSDEDYRYIRVSADAKTGKIISLYKNSEYSEKELSRTQIESAEKKITEFLNVVAQDDIKECDGLESDVYRNKASKHYVRIVNGVKYIDNGINVSFNAEANSVESFNLNFTKAEFENPKNAIGEEDAYGKILEYAPLIPLYIRAGETYKRVFTLDCYNMQIDAVTGEAMEGYLNESKNYAYKDTEGHWVEEAAEKLAEIQVGFDGDMLNPEQIVTQSEFLKFVASGIYSKHYAEYSDEDLYRLLISDGILTEEEKIPQSPVTREQAFVYIIRFAKIEKVAELSNIYKVSYADGNLLSDGKLGYAAILSGLGVICGDGGYLRPADTLTRAEAVIMLYRYLIRM